MCSLYLGENLISGNKPINLGVRNIGEIFPASLPITDAGAHLLDGGLILGGGIYQGFVDYIADLYTANPSANYFTTEALWQQSVTTYGVCGKFVYDSVNNTVRLPKVTGIIEGTVDASALGDLVEAGLPSLPQHTHNYTRFPQGSTYLTRFQYTGGSYPGEAGWGYQTVQSDGASTVTGGLYGNSSTVQPQTTKAFYYIVIANSTKTEIQSDIDEIATDLNGKADVDLTNCTKPHIVETYKNGTSWYRVYSDGWCEQGGVGHMTVQVTLIKPYIDNSYLVIAQMGTAGFVQTYYNQVVYQKDNTSFTTNIYQGNSSIGFFWRTCGYIN